MLGTSYSNSSNEQREFHPSVYSPYKMNNAQSEVDSTCLSFSFWNGNLKISIYPRKNTGKDGQIAFDYSGGISIYLNHTKARIFAEEIKKFMSDPEKYDNVGVPSKQTIITVSQGKEYNSPSPLIIIRKVDEAGKVMSSFAYQVKTNFFFSVRGYKEGTDFQKVFSDYDNLELLQLITICEEFYRASSYAYAFATIDAYQNQTSYFRSALSQIGSKLGVEISGASGGSRSYSSNSFFNNYSPSGGGNTTEYAKGSLDELD